MAFPDTAPRKGDSDNNLLFKIAQELSEQNGGAFAPFLGDSDNVLLRKILQGIILGGSGSGGTCPADLAACSANLAACSAALAILQAQYNSSAFATTTPTNYPIAASFGYVTNGLNYPGLTGLNFLPASTISGYDIQGLTSLTTLTFPNLTSIPLNAFFNLSTNPALASVSFPVLTTAAVTLTLLANGALTTLSMPVVTSMAGINATSVGLISLSLPALTTFTSTLTMGSAPNLTTVSLPVLTTSRGFTLSGNVALTSVSAPLLSSVAAGNFTFASDTALTTLNFSSLVSMAGGGITATGCTALTSLSLPALVTLAGATGLNCNGSTSLTTLTLPNYLPTSTRPQNFGNCALTQASVDLVLARCVANAAYVSGTVTLNGGTNSTPSAAGLVDKAILVGRGVTVLNN